MSELRFYYKNKEGTAYYCLKSSEFDNNENYVAISEQEWNEHLKEIGEGE